MDISNKTLAMFLVAAIVVSIAGTTISLNKLGDMGGPTGYAFSDTGNVTVTVREAVSIIINTTGPNDNNLSFTCSPNSTKDSTINSEGTIDTSAVCSVYPNNSSIHVYNDGNVDANVSINVSNTGEAHASGTFLSSPGSNSWIAYRIFNGSNGLACNGNYPSSYTNFTNTSLFYQACDNLSYLSNGNFDFAIEMLLPQSADTVTGDFVEITFWAKEAT